MKHVLALAILLTGAAQAASLAAVSPAQPMPAEETSSSAPIAIENWTAGTRSAGSAALVPLMAADSPAAEAGHIDGPADDAGVAARKLPDDVSFVRQATENGREEVNAAREALPQLRKPELKRIAEMLVNDHGAANARLAQLVENKGWPVPGPETAVPPAATAGGDFDSQWTAAMIAGHERSLALYRAQAQHGADKDLRNFARDTLPTIEHHLAELRSVQK